MRSETVRALHISADIYIFLIRPQISGDDWTLIINKTELGDSGSYQCSVNTLPKISHSVGLEVEDPGLRIMQDSPARDWGRLEARIDGPRTQYVSQGSTIALHCSISHLEAPPSSLYWTRNGRVFTAKDRAGISLESEKVATTSSSKLFISRILLRWGGHSLGSSYRVCLLSLLSATLPTTPVSRTSPSQTASSWWWLRVDIEIETFREKHFQHLFVSAVPGYALMFSNEGSYTHTGHLQASLIFLLLSHVIYGNHNWLQPFLSRLQHMASFC